MSRAVYVEIVGDSQPDDRLKVYLDRLPISGRLIIASTDKPE